MGTQRELRPWPSIPVAAWEDTRDTLQLYTQVVGKLRLANEPLVNHCWNTADDRNAVLLAFLQSTYDAAASGAASDRDALERPVGDGPAAR